MSKIAMAVGTRADDEPCGAKRVEKFVNQSESEGHTEPTLLSLAALLLLLLLLLLLGNNLNITAAELQLIPIHGSAPYPGICWLAGWLLLLLLLLGSGCSNNTNSNNLRTVRETASALAASGGRANEGEVGGGVVWENGGTRRGRCCWLWTVPYHAVGEAYMVVDAKWRRKGTQKGTCESVRGTQR
uniref:Uncharacterized protein n=1 Tax=Anopheles culicifacies TaxID=139723 RepID=A0A182MIJ5_9DIPT